MEISREILLSKDVIDTNPCPVKVPLTDAEKKERNRIAVSAYYKRNSKARNAWQTEYNKKYRAENPEKVKLQQRRKDLKRKFNLTPEQWEELFIAQGSCCAICKTKNLKIKGIGIQTMTMKQAK